MRIARDRTHAERRVPEMVFVDHGVAAGDLLLAGLRPGVEGVRLAADEPPLAQIARHVEGRGPLATLHVVVHGAPGRLGFTAGAVDEQVLRQSAGALRRIRDTLRPGAEVRLWSCDVAAGVGASFVGALAAATGAAVAAASGRIGAPRLGGAWSLDAGTAGARTGTPFTPATIADYPGILAVVTGTSSDDTLTGTAEDDIVNARPGNDLVSGLDGNDSLFGQPGADTLSGGDGDDFLWGGGGADSMVGGDGADYFYGSASDLSGDTIADFTFGEDGILISGVTSLDSNRIAAAGDTWSIDVNGDGTPDIVLSIPGVSGSAVFAVTSPAGFPGHVLISAGSGTTGDDTLFGLDGANSIAGGDGNDLIAGGEGDDTLAGGSGNDKLYGGAGNDRVGGDHGDDSLDGGDGDDLMYGGIGNDLLVGAAGNDSLSGEAGNDTLHGGAGDDLVRGGAGNDQLSGGAGNDSLYAGVGADTLVGGTGGDLLVVDGGDRIDVASTIAEFEGDTISGFGATDQLRAGGATLTLAGQSRDASSATVTLAVGSDTISMSFAGDYRSGAFVLNDSGDALLFDSVAPTLASSSPADNATGVAPGADIVLNFSETVRAGTTGAIVVKRIADDVAVSTISFDDSTQLTFSGSQLIVNPTADLAYGTGYYLQISPGAITDAAGNEFAGISDAGTFNFTTADSPSGGGDGGGGSTDVIVVTPTTPGSGSSTTTPSGQPSVTETVSNTSTSQSGTAALVQDTGNSNLVTATLPPQVSLVNEGARTATSAAQAREDLVTAITIKDPVGNKDAQTTVAEAWIASRPTGTLLDIRTLTLSAPAGAAPAEPIVIAGTASGQGSSFQEAFVIDVTNLPPGTIISLRNIEFASIKGSVQVTGGDGSNFVIGDDAAQIIVLGEDDDTLMGGGGDDRIGSAGGNDVLYGNQGVDTVTGGGDADTLYGGQDADLLYGNLAGDVLYGNRGSDTLYGGQDADLAYGGQDADLIYGNLGDDRLFGGAGQDTLYGGAGNDLAAGGDGNDALLGNLGDDTLSGGGGADTLRGGGGDDLLIGGDGGDVFLIGAGDGHDTIEGFTETAGDRLVLDEGTVVLSTASRDGDTILTLTGGGTVTLRGVAPVAPPDEEVEVPPPSVAGRLPTDDVMAWLGGGDD